MSPETVSHTAEGIVADTAAGDLPDGELLRPLAERFPAVVFETVTGQDVARVDAGQLVEFAEAAREAGFKAFTDLAAVDHLHHRRPRFEIVVTLTSYSDRSRLRISVPAAGDPPTVPSITAVFPGANFYEREAYDLFGVRFEGHPDLTRILLPDDWAGHPLRKDAPVGSVPVQFKGSHKVT